MKYKSFIYSHSGNLGDEVQTFAAELHLPTLDGHVDRDGLALLDENEEPFVVIMNGWYSNNPTNCLPAAKCVIPVFWGMHINTANKTNEYFLSGDRLEYLKHHEPIGCRDPQTMEMLQGKGVKAFYSKCVTHTFPKREKEPVDGKIFLCDMPNIPVPSKIHRVATQMSQFEKDYYGVKIRRLKSQKNLDILREQASLVITSKIHCAMPCVAMGIPVIYFGQPDEYRVKVLKDMGLTVYQKPSMYVSGIYRLLSKTKLGDKFRDLYVKLFYRNVDWNPEVIPYEEEKAKLITELKEHMNFCIERHKQRKGN